MGLFHIGQFVGRAGVSLNTVTKPSFPPGDGKTPRQEYKEDLTLSKTATIIYVKRLMFFFIFKMSEAISVF